MSAWLISHDVPMRLNVARKSLLNPAPCAKWLPGRLLSTSSPLRRASDPRIRELGREIFDDYAALRDSYSTE